MTLTAVTVEMKNGNKQHPESMKLKLMLAERSSNN